MYCNFDRYKDKTIIVEGMYAQFYSWDGSETAVSYTHLDVYKRQA